MVTYHSPGLFTEITLFYIVWTCAKITDANTSILHTVRTAKGQQGSNQFPCRLQLEYKVLDCANWS